jgi:hypothetical protein
MVNYKTKGPTRDIAGSAGKPGSHRGSPNGVLILACNG